MRKKNHDEFDKDDFEESEEETEEGLDTDEVEAETDEEPEVKDEAVVVEDFAVVPPKEVEEDEWSDTPEREGWIIIGWAADRTTANFVVETLKSYDITAVVESKSGFLGDVGLTLSAGFEDSHGAYEIWTPEEGAEEAIGLAEMVGGDKWESADIE